MHRIGAAAAAGAALAVADAYWSRMSPYSQRFGAFPYAAATPARRIALTFDDGPNEPYTSQIALVLAQFDIRATFFHVARNVERQSDSARALLEQGHLIGNHSYSHRFGRSARAATACDEIDRAQDVLGERLGVVPALFRPPWLLRSRTVLAHLALRGLQPVSGSFCHPLEPAQVSARRITRGALRHGRPGAMLIFHDGYNDRGASRRQTVDAVGRTIEALLDDGFDFVTVDRLLAVPAYR